jgi:RNA polymerase sigma-70 factor (ECF subfamily)
LELPLDAAVEPVGEGSDEPAAARLEVERALRQLPAKLRELVWLAEVEGWTSVEIARLAGASAGVVRVRLHRARQKLKALLVPMA